MDACGRAATKPQMVSTLGAKDLLLLMTWHHILGAQCIKKGLGAERLINTDQQNVQDARVGEPDCGLRGAELASASSCTGAQGAPAGPAGAINYGLAVHDDAPGLACTCVHMPYIKQQCCGTHRICCATRTSANSSRTRLVMARMGQSGWATHRGSGDAAQ